MQNGTDRKKKRLGAALSALVMGGILLVVILCLLWDCFTVGITAAERVVLLLCAALGLFTIGGILLALRQRWNEIEGGEEDEAKKY